MPSPAPPDLPIVSRFPGTPTGASPRTFTPGPTCGVTPAPNVPTGFEDNAEDHSELDRSHKRRRDDAA
jgi:hypothetical protein